MVQNSRQYVDRTLTYGPSWSASASVGQPVTRAQLASPGVFFTIKTNETDTDALLALTDASAANIEWLDEDAGQIRIKFGTNTAALAGDAKYYELRVKLTGGDNISVERGRFNIVQSIVD